MYEMTGKVAHIGDTQTFDKGFTKREFVIDNGNKFASMVKFELTKDNCSLIDSFRVGDNVKVGFWVNGNEWKGKYYTNLSANEIAAEEQNTVGQSVKASDITPNTGGIPVSKPVPQETTAPNDLPW